MLKKAVLFCSLFFLGLAPAQAAHRGHLVFTHALLGASAGTLVGAAAGLCAYGNSKNQNGELLAADAAYGFVGGAVAGTGWVLVQNDLPAYTYGYTAAGAGMGAACGLVFGMFAWALSIPEGGDPENFNRGSTAAGIGALAGAALGLGAATVQFQITPANSKNDTDFTLEIQPEPHHWAEKPGAKPHTLLACRLLEIQF